MAFESGSKDAFDSQNDVGLVYTSDRFGRVRFPPGYSQSLCRKEYSSDGPVLKGARCSFAVNGDAIHSPMPLYQICLDFVAQNINIVESLEDFPDIIGQQLFKTVHECHGFIEDPCALQLFFKAYGELVLKNLSLSGRHILANNKLEQLLLFSRLRELDLSHCRLGSDHELLSYIGNIESLLRLSLKDNCLSDDAIARMSLPHRLLGAGLGKLLVLDLSCNPSITDNSIKCLLKFHLLQALNLSGTGVTFRFGVAKLVNTTNLQVTTEVAEFQKESFTSNDGWAAGVIDEWIELSKKIPNKECHARASGARRFYQVKTARAIAANQSKVGDKTSCDRPLILLKAKKNNSARVDRFVFGQSASSYAYNSRPALSGKRKTSPLLSARPKRSNGQSSTLANVDSEEDWTILSEYIMTGTKQNAEATRVTSLIDALGTCSKASEHPVN